MSLSDSVQVFCYLHLQLFDLYFLIPLGWLRQNCMMVFHYLAEELKGESLFDNEIEESLETGAVYNDFDSSPLDTLMDYEETERFSFSQSSAFHSTPIQGDESIVPAVDTAVMDAGTVDGIQYKLMQWDSPYFDNESKTCDEDYCKKEYICWLPIGTMLDAKFF